MEWSTETQQFVRMRPEPSPVLTVTVSIMEKSYKDFDRQVPKAQPLNIVAVADSGCQTSTAGKGILRMMGLSEEVLMSTRHRIVGVTDHSLDIIGVLLMEIKLRDKTSCQMVYISNSRNDMYLSKSCLKDLGIISQKFPETEVSVSAASTTPAETSTHDNCKCIPRATAPERPTRIPYDPIPENVHKIKQWMVDRFSGSAFNQCTHQELPVMTGEPMDIIFKDDHIPYAVHTPIKVPIHWESQVLDAIRQDERLGILEQVPPGSPVVWCSRMVVAPKKNGKPRRTVDMQKVKNATLRETHFTPSPFNIVSRIPKNTFKSVLDAWNGYHSLPLSPKAKDATTFITQWGRYRYKRAPQGYHASGDVYTRRFDDITSEFERVSRCIDDSLLWNNNIESSFWHVYDYIKHCSDNGIIFNPEKFVFAEKDCEFAGFEVTSDGFRPPQRKLDSIQSFPRPSNITDLRSWFGLINQMKYAFRQTNYMEPFRSLLKQKNATWYWDDNMTKIFEDSKQKIIEAIREGVKAFEKDRITCLGTDYSKQGVGYTLTQKYCNCEGPYTPNCGEGHWRITLCGSRFTTEAESRYSPSEGEALAVVYGLKQCRDFILGCPNLIVATDHQALLGILNDRHLETIENPRLLRMKEKTLMYDFRIIYVPGKTHFGPDFLSRHPPESSKKENQTIEDANLMEASSVAFAIRQSVNLPSSINWLNVNDAASVDSQCVRLKELIQNGFPDSRDKLPTDLRYFWPMKDELYVIDHVTFKGRKMLIPAELRSQVLEGLHAGHQGTSSMSSNARERFFWPRLDADIKLRRDQCQQCNQNAPSQSAECPIVPKEPDMPFEQVACDLCKIGQHTYLVYADRMSGWTEVAKLKNESFKSVKKHFLQWFERYGAPEEIASDGGPPFNGHEYKDFMRRWNVEVRLSSAYYAQSNGRAEVAVKTIKRLLIGNRNPLTGDLDTEQAARALLSHRNTPNQSSRLSPAEMLYGHKIRDHLPNKFRKLRKDWRAVKRMQEMKHVCLPHENTRQERTLKPLAAGDAVSVQNQKGNKPNKWHNTGKVVEALPNRKYKIILDGSRNVTNRNRKFIRPILEQCRNKPDPGRNVEPTIKSVPQVPSQPDAIAALTPNALEVEKVSSPVIPIPVILEARVPEALPPSTPMNASTPISRRRERRSSNFPNIQDDTMSELAEKIARPVIRKSGRDRSKTKRYIEEA